MASGDGRGAAKQTKEPAADTAAGTTANPKPKQSADAAASKARKRTKTGCLTCRKRRIKCGEERPICNNCVKSKRHCEGYNQRVIFKPPIGDWPAAQSNTLPFHSGVIPGGRPGFQQPFPGSTSAGVSFNPQHHFALPQHGQFIGVDPFNGGSFAGLAPDASPGPGQMDPVYNPRSYSMGAIRSDFAPQTISPSAVASQVHRQSVQLPYHPTTPPPQAQPVYRQTAQGYNRARHAYQQSQFTQGPHSQFPTQTSYKDPDLVTQDLDMFHAADQDVLVWHKVANGLAGDGERLEMLRHHQQQKPQSQQQIMRPQVARNAGRQQTIVQTPPVSQQAVPFNGLLQRSGYAEDHVSPTEILQDAAVEYEDDDYYDVQSEDEMESVPQQAMTHGQQRDFEVMLQIHRDSVNDLTVRSYGAFLSSGMLEHYRAEWVANPLRNPKTARVFAHFIHATGPSLSIFERRVRNASAMFSEGPVHPSQQSLWTYTLPMMALNHQGLLHAMLALSSLHIAKLQGASVTPSFKHYAYALKRVHHAVGHPKRHHITTLAACLMLGFYEVMTADHVKWSSHLLGAKQLFVEIDYSGMTKAYRKKKAEEDAFERKFAYENPGLTMHQPRHLSKETNMMPDERLVGTLLGKKLRYDDFGKVFEDVAPRRDSAMPQEQGLTHYETYQDLWWWYVRHDAFQSVISGNMLFMDYSRWSDCPPRAPLGKPDALYGTHDHLLLLLGRIADFSARDRERKIKAVEANGGQWRPGLGTPSGPSPTTPMGGFMTGQQVQPGMKVYSGYHPNITGNRNGCNLAMAGPRSAGMAQVPAFPGRPPQPGAPPPPPSFYGMAPSTARNHMPPAFAPQTERSPSSKSSSSNTSNTLDLETATASALAEWTSIRAAITTWKSHLGPAFAPLSAEYTTPIPTPFGPALQYRSFDIAVLWAQYHMLEIILTRSHPSMPPAAMIAAAVVASQTAHWANEIGRIAAGIMSGYTTSSTSRAAPEQTTRAAPLNPSIGAALIESVMPLFFAGIQYTDAAQRDWLVTRIKDVEARTGWASAGLVANGCQKVWERAGQAGRAPPYVYRREDANPDERISGRREERARSEGRELTPEEEALGRSELSDRRFIWTNPGTRVHWAMGILSGEEDVIRPPGV